MNTQEEPNNNTEGQKFSEMINNIFFEDDVLNTGSARKSVDNEERKLITPKFSPLNLKNLIKFDFCSSSIGQGKQTKQKALVLLLKSW
jgi:hypothetical protein